MTKVLVKANNDVLSHCTCNTAFATSGQMDCPWCGCGWLFSCTTCRKAFTFARVVTRDDVPDDPTIYAGDDLDQFEVGEIAIYLDGHLLGPGDTDLDCTGYFAHHTLTALPHATAKEKADLDSIFGDKSYWLDHKRPEKPE